MYRTKQMSQGTKPNFAIRAEYAGRIRWATRGCCGEPGCTDPECACSLCGKPIGFREDDPRWVTHDRYCVGCDLCVDDIPVILWRPNGAQAQFHDACFGQIFTVKDSKDDEPNSH